MSVVVARLDHEFSSSDLDRIFANNSGCLDLHLELDLGGRSTEKLNNDALMRLRCPVYCFTNHYSDLPCAWPCSEFNLDAYHELTRATHGQPIMLCQYPIRVWHDSSF